VFAVGVALFEGVRRRFARRWGVIQDDIEARIAQQEVHA
jgi:branched-chain amino acid transport system permease protein